MQNQVRLVWDDSKNSIYVQAVPADLAEIKKLVSQIDSETTESRNDLRIVPLRVALSDELVLILLEALASNVYTSNQVGVPAVSTTTGAGGVGLGTTGLAAGRGGLNLGGTSSTTSVTGLPATRSTVLRFLKGRDNNKTVVESGWLEDVHIISEPRTNALLVIAPEKTMDLIMALIKELDRVPEQIKARISVFPLKRADATSVGTMLQQLFLGTTSSTMGRSTTGGMGGLGGTSSSSTSGRSYQPGSEGQTIAGIPLIDLRLNVDPPSNSVLIAGSEDQVFQVEAILTKLDSAPTQTRHTEIYHLRNAAAADVANALTTFIGYYLNNVYGTSGAATLTNYQILQQQIILVPEPITNQLLINVAPEVYPDLMRWIHQLDEQPAQVMITVLIAEVDLTGTEEFGCEIGLQSPLLFARASVPGTTSYTGLTSNTDVLGYYFNQTQTGSVANSQNISPGTVGFQGLGNLGVGRADPTSGIGGFVFSAASNSFSLLIRALKQQGRLDILTRPTITTLDNQSASLEVGQSYPYISGTTITSGIAQNNVLYRDVGILLTVTPRISPEGRVLMRVFPEVSSPSSSPVVLSSGGTQGTQNATVFNVQQFQTTVAAEDGETVVIAGLLTKNDSKNENKIPYFGDLPWIGAAFRYRTQVKTKRELLLIMTPHVIRCRADSERLLAAEASRVHWVTGDVAQIYGPCGLNNLARPAGNPDGQMPAPIFPPAQWGIPGGQVPPSGMMSPGPMVPSAPFPGGPGPNTLPYPRQAPFAPQGQAPFAPQSQAPAPTATAALPPMPSPGLPPGAPVGVPAPPIQQGPPAGVPVGQPYYPGR